MIYVTGDIHGNLGVSRLEEGWLLPEGLTKDDYVIVLGDFGLVWFPEGDERGEEDERWLDWLEERPFTTLFIDGNHENHDLLAAMPVETWGGGKVHRVRDSVLHLMRGQVFDIDGSTFFTMGGAYSHDIQYRVEGVSWWRTEVPSMAERDEALANLEACGWKVDYVLTHCGPSGAIPRVTTSCEPIYPDAFTNWLEHSVGDVLDYRMWFFGHYHETRRMAERHWLLYEDIYDLQKGALL